MSRSVKFFFDFGSPNAYLSHKVIPQVEGRTGASFEYVPILLGGVFKLTGNQSPVIAYAPIRNKLEYEGMETRRYVARHGITTFRKNPFFPINTLQMMRGAVAAKEVGVFERYVDEMFACVWERELDMNNPEIFRKALVDGGLPAGDLLERAKSDPVKAKLMANTEEAVALGAFGSPTFLVGNELFFGKDKLRDVEEEIVRSSGASSAA